MTPQSHFVIVAPVIEGREAALRALLETMNDKPGQCDPRNALLPLGEFETLHFARFAVLGDGSARDLEAFGLAAPVVPTCLAFIADCDGPASVLMASMVERAGDGLRLVFGHCVGCEEAPDLLAWLAAHDRPVAAPYVNTIGRTVRQIREERALQRALSARVVRGAPVADPCAVHRQLMAFVNEEVRAGRLALTPSEPTPTAWAIGNLLHALLPPLIAIAVVAGLLRFIGWLPTLVLLALAFIAIAAVLRKHETNDPEFCPRPSDADVLAMQRLEDHDITNSFTALGPVKPGGFRRGLVQVLLFLIAYAARHVFARGHLARVRTIHFAHWIFLDDKQHVLFVSNYDGSHESYMDDFINKAAWGLNLVFSNGFGWPRTQWLLFGGARHEMRFKHYQRGHQLPTQCWYKAYPGLSLGDIARNQRIRAGIDRADLDEREALAWLALL